MNVIDSNGDYEYVTGTRTLKSSEHPAYQARIELALPRGAWIGAPGAGHDLERFTRKNQTDAVVEEFRKEVRFYLQRYSPEVQDAMITRQAATFGVVIPEAADD